MIRDQSVGDLMGSIASSSPTPGGGAVAGLAGATGASLISMVARLTEGRDGFEALDDRMREIRARCDREREAFLELADRDSAAFDAVMAAFKLPKATAGERSARSAAIQAAFVGAAEVPLEVATRSTDLMDLAREVVAEGNPDAASDGMSAGALLFASTLCALANVAINTTSIKDEAVASRLRAGSERLSEASSATMRRIEEAFHDRVNG